MCTALCTIAAHNIAQNRPDSFPSYPPDNHHCSDDVYLREWGLYQRQEIDNLSVQERVFCEVCTEKGARSFVVENLKKLDGTVISGYGSIQMDP